MSSHDQPDPESANPKRCRLPTPDAVSGYAREYLEMVKAKKALLKAQASAEDQNNDTEEVGYPQQTQNIENDEQDAPEHDGNNNLEQEAAGAENTNVTHSLYVRLKITAALKARLCQLTSVRKRKVRAPGPKDVEKPNEDTEPEAVNPPVENSAEGDSDVEANNLMEDDRLEQNHNISAEKQDDVRSLISDGNSDDDDLFGDRQLDHEGDQRKITIYPSTVLGFANMVPHQMARFRSHRRQWRWTHHRRRRRRQSNPNS